MNIKFIRILFSIILVFFFSLPGICTELPVSVIKYVKEKFPEAGIRFDGMVELADGSKYLPILPIVWPEEKKPLEVTQTIPADLDFSEKPDMVLFNNNLALLKIIKKEGEAPTVISSNKMPLKVKLGLLPQDLVVPRGLILPPELKVVLGDLKIPLKPKTDKEGEVAFYGRAEVSENKEGKIIGETTEHITKLAELNFLNEKKLYASSYRLNKINVIDSQTGRMESVIDLPTIAFDMVLSSDKRYLLLPASSAGKIFVVDTLNNEFVKSIPVGKHPTSIISPAGKNKAYVANRFSSSISEIDLINMQAEREIPVKGQPEYIQVADNNDYLFYTDARTGDICKLHIETGNSWPLFNVKNISTLKQWGRYLMVLSRTADTLTVYDMKKSEIINKTVLGKKPLDLEVVDDMGKILVVCAGSNELNIVDMENFEVVKKIPLGSGAFPGKISLVNDETMALITNHDAYEIIIYNVVAEKIHGHLPVNRFVSSVVVSNK